MAEKCPNCGHLLPVDAAYCSQCGQRRIPDRETLWTLIRDWLGLYFFAGNSKVPATLRRLLWPGALFAEYMRGRRRRYLRPLHLFVFSFMVFWFVQNHLAPSETTPLISLRIFGQQTHRPGITLRMGVEAPNETLGKIEKIMADSTVSNATKEAFIDSLLAETPIYHFQGWLYLKMARMAFLKGKVSLEQYYFRLFEKTYFLYAPLVALFIWLVWRRAVNGYYAALVFTLYLMSAYLLWDAVVILLTNLVPSLGFLSLLGMLAYLWAASYRVFHRSILTTTGATLLLVALFGVIGLPLIFLIQLGALLLFI